MISKELIKQKTRIQLVSFYLPQFPHEGSGKYVTGFLQFLKKAQCEIECVWLPDEWMQGAPIIHIPHNLSRLAKFVAPRYINIGNTLFSRDGFVWWERILSISIFDLLSKKQKALLRDFRKMIFGGLINRESNYVVQKQQKQLWGHIPIKRELDFFQERRVRFKPHIVIADCVVLSKVLEKVPDNILKVIISHEVKWQRRQSFVSKNAPFYEIEFTSETEANEFRKADVILAIQEDDEKAIKEMVPEKKVILLPCFDLAERKLDDKKQVYGRCLFVGSPAPQNINGLRWFLENVWPVITKRLPHANLHVCGGVCNYIQTEYPSVKCLGFVKDLSSQYEEAEVCLLPLLIGSGLKIKLIEALSYGRACVSTSLGVQGVQSTINRGVVEANDEITFANAVINLVNDSRKRKQLEKEAIRYVKENLTFEAASPDLLNLIRGRV